MRSILCCKRRAGPGMKPLVSMLRCDNVLTGQSYRTSARALTDECETIVD
jgi:hypothetical protein